MRKKEELKTERKTVLMTKSLMENIEQEALERGIKANAVMVERLSHSESKFTPRDMAKIQTLVNHACELVKEYLPQEADQMQEEANEIWKFLK